MRVFVVEMSALDPLEVREIALVCMSGSRFRRYDARAARIDSDG